MKRIIVSVTNDLSGDQRVDRVCRTLTEMGFSVLLVGRQLPASQPVDPRPYDTRRMKLLFRKGVLFYAGYNIRLLLFLLFRRFDLLLSNDLDTLTANRIAGWLKRKPVVYDSHEYFTEVPELVGRPRVKKIWEWLERCLVPGVDAAFTVCEPIAEIYSEKYGVPFSVVRNVPYQEAMTSPDDQLKRDPGHSEGANGTPEMTPAAASSEETIVRRKKNTGDPWLKSRKLPLIIYQGALNKGRGLEQAIRAMEMLPEAELIIAGGGDLENELQELVASRGIKNVRFTGRLSAEALKPLTRQAMLGISVEEDLGLNYRYALPNKLFDYIQARIPVVVSDLPEMSRLVKKYDIGIIAPSHDPEALAATFRKALTNDTLRQKWAFNLETAAHELNWDNEKAILKELFRKFF